MGNWKPLLGDEGGLKLYQPSQFRLSLDHPCPFKNSLSKLWSMLVVSQIQAM